MKNFNMKGILEELSLERPIFHSEADFQFSLAWKIKENYPNYEIFLEWPIENQYKYTDILLKKDEKIIPIELKYKTKVFKYNEFNLKNHGAKDLACYDFLKDIERVESLISTNFEKGFSIFLTNDLGFLNKPSVNAGYKEFSIHDGRKIDKGSTLNWGELISEGTKRGRKKAISLKFAYHFKWEDYSDLNEELVNSKFKYLFAEIKNI